MEHHRKPYPTATCDVLKGLDMHHTKLPEDSIAIKSLSDRVTGAEHDIRSLTKAVSDGFSQSNESLTRLQGIIEDNNARQNVQSLELQKNVSKRSETNWTLLVAAIMCAFAIGGAIVAFVNMSINPINKDIVEDRTHMDYHIKQGGHTLALIKLAKLEDRTEDLFYETEKLHKFSDEDIVTDSARDSKLASLEANVAHMAKELDRRWGEIISGAEERGITQSVITHLHEALADIRSRLDKAREDPFRGKEGDALAERIGDLEKYLREKCPTVEKKD